MGAQEGEGNEVQGDPQVVSTGTPYPTPIPEDWKTERAKKAELWFQASRDAALRRFQDKENEVILEAERAAQAEQQAKREAQLLKNFHEHHEQRGSHIQCTLNGRIEEVASDHLGRLALRFPHFTSVRPITVLYSSQAAFREKLFVRGLVSTMLGNAKQLSSQEGGAEQQLSGAHSPIASNHASELVWWDMLQPRLAMGETSLCRMEAIQRCRVVILVMSTSYASSNEFAGERELVLNRLLDPPGPNHRPITVIVLRYSPETHAAPALSIPPIPKGHPAAAAVAAGVVSDGSLPSRTSSSAHLKIPSNPPSPSSMSMPTLTRLVQREIGRDLTVRQQIQQSIEILRGYLLEATDVDFPEEEDVQVYLHPSEALLGAPIDLSMSLAATATSLSSLPSAIPLDPGAACAAAYQMPTPLGLTKPIEDWSIHDVQAWIRSFGGCYDRYCWSFRKLCVDGWLLMDLDDDVMNKVIGVDDKKARTTILTRLKKMLTSSSRLASTGNILPAGGELAVELFTLSPGNRYQVLLDIFLYFDRDNSGDLNMGELKELLTSVALHVEGVEVSMSVALHVEGVEPVLIMAEYDVDSDGALSKTESLTLLFDIWKLLVASRDAAAWNLPPVLLEDDLSEMLFDRNGEDADSIETADQVRRSYLGGGNNNRKQVPVAAGFGGGGGGVSRKSAIASSASAMSTSAFAAYAVGRCSMVSLARSSTRVARSSTRVAENSQKPHNAGLTVAGNLSTQTSTKSALKTFNSVAAPPNAVEGPEDLGLIDNKSVGLKKNMMSLASSGKSKVSLKAGKQHGAEAEAAEPGSEWTAPEPPVFSVKKLSVSLNVAEDYEGHRAARAAATTAASPLDEEAGGGDESEQLHRSRRSNATTQKSIHFNEDHLVQMQPSESTLVSTLGRFISLENSSLSLNSMDTKPSPSAQNHNQNHSLRPGARVPVITSLSALQPLGHHSNKPFGKSNKLASAPSMAVYTAGMMETGGARSLAASSRGGRSLVATNAAIAELDEFFDSGFTTAVATSRLRGDEEASDLAEVLTEVLKKVDMKRSGRVSGAAVVGALGNALPKDMLSPYELWLLSGIAPAVPSGTASLKTSAAAPEVPIEHFVNDAVEGVARWQQGLMNEVYGGPQKGMQKILWKLYMQLRPLPAGCIASDSGLLISQLPEPDDWDGDEEPPNPLIQAPLNREESLQILRLLVDLQVDRASAPKPSLLVLIAIAQEAQKAADAWRGSGNDVNVWSSVAAHMLYVFWELS
ncbi:hypothetical protein CEUSTIGMA_g7662.t1 [Chlamydomonas eustigma]|uniref:Uncharacterized protein n=1 Tax=Chlamydomonas eustigma TaxID=1157962 RepID=A0A250XAZ0_9CHLO|nr:hypothetical protein CEUSTIGMA_g7662.t1 [Chlamydomonas eustigma]|eukprot:GAX80224.1 hypothetical protein CEUSTIGMA_g7662.t1 [Chlamydomonas eustigma]